MLALTEGIGVIYQNALTLLGNCVNPSVSYADSSLVKGADEIPRAFY